MRIFESVFKKLAHDSSVQFPNFTGTRVMMMPVRLGSLVGVPKHYHSLVDGLYAMTSREHLGEIGYLTVDEQVLDPGQTLRRKGLHVDGYYHGSSGAWGGGPGGAWASVGNGMLTVSSTPHCRAYAGWFDGQPGPEGECDHLQPPTEGTVFEANQVYWVDGACVHESMPVQHRTKRQFVRLSMPSSGPWFEGYTTNPAGVQPSHEILPRRDQYM